LLVIHVLGLLSAFGKLPPPRLASVPATWSVPSHLTPPLSPCAGHRALLEPRAAPRLEGLAPSPPLTFGAINHAGELRLFVVPLLALIQCLGPCQAGAARSMDASHGHLPVGCPVTGRRWQRHVARQCHALHTVWTLTWYVHGLRFRPRHAR
jgi:hypothetical protein